MYIYKYINITLLFIIYIILLYYANLFFNTKHNKIINDINKKILIENFGSCLEEYSFNSVQDCIDNISPKCKDDNENIDDIKTREYCEKLHSFKDVLNTKNSSCDDINIFKDSLKNLYCSTYSEKIEDVINAGSSSQSTDSP